MRAPEKFESTLEGCDVVFHTAAHVREYYQPGDHKNALQETNAKATLALMRRAAHTASESYGFLIQEWDKMRTD